MVGGCRVVTTAAATREDQASRKDREVGRVFGKSTRVLAKRAAVRGLHGRHTRQAAIAMLHEDLREAIDLLLESSDVVDQTLVVHGESLNLVLELVEPRLLALTALECSCLLALATAWPRMHLP